MKGLEYYTSERFIHDDLVKSAETGLPSILSGWKAYGKLEPFMISWPAEVVAGDDGIQISGPICRSLSHDPKKRLEEIRVLIERTGPYALLLGDQLDHEVRVIFESQHGSKSWCYPIERHGPDRVLGRVSIDTNKLYLGILWRPDMAKA